MLPFGFNTSEVSIQSWVATRPVWSSSNPCMADFYSEWVSDTWKYKRGLKGSSTSGINPKRYRPAFAVAACPCKRESVGGLRAGRHRASPKTTLARSPGICPPFIEGLPSETDLNRQPTDYELSVLRLRAYHFGGSGQFSSALRVWNKSGIVQHFSKLQNQDQVACNLLASRRRNRYGQFGNLADLYEGMMDYADILAERRKFPRFPVNLPLEFGRMNESRRRAGVAADISKMGLQVLSIFRMMIGTELRLTILFPIGYELSTFDVAAKIVWKTSYDGGDWSGYKYGVKFTRISEKDRLKLDFFINAHLSVHLSTNEISERPWEPHISEVGDSTLLS